MISRMGGTVKFFDDPRGYGFIVGDDGREYFVHRTKIKPVGDGIMTLERAQKVSFEPGESGKGLTAVFVESAT